MGVKSAVVVRCLMLMLALTIVVSELYCGRSRREGYNLSAEHRLLTVREVAGAMRVSTMTVYRLIRDGQLPAIRVGKHFRIRATDVDAFLAARMVNGGGAWPAA